MFGGEKTNAVDYSKGVYFILNTNYLKEYHVVS